MQRLDQRRSTSMINVGLCNSASAPVFPSLNLRRMLDLDVESIEDEIFEEEINDDLWNNSLIRQDESAIVEFMLQQMQRESNNSSSDNSAMNNDEDRDGWDEPVEGVQNVFPGLRPGLFDERLFADLSAGRMDHTNDRTSTSPAFVYPIDGDWERYANDTLIDENNNEIWNEDTGMNTFENSSPASYMEFSKRDKSQQKDTGEYLMLSTAKDLFLLSTVSPKMAKIRHEPNVISQADIRTDRLLSTLDRITMVEWIPELELYITASQKGTVALVRILQLELEDRRQISIFNTECYLPMDVLQTTPLYGMTVKKVTGERFSPTVYQVFLFYFGGNVLGYNISRKDSRLTADNFAYL
ncbi:hypothetical protein BY458DRAFT_165567 [Sporodiniella umbellata]|nr:hypothetical protein BY458DRAFT_165567 [Sporodiniella umbellata]